MGVQKRSNTVQMDLPSYPTGGELITAEAGRIFLHLEDKKTGEVAYLFGLDRYYKNEASMKSAVQRAYQLVLSDPLKYDITTEKAAFIQGIVQSRSLQLNKPETLREEEDLIKMDIGTLILIRIQKP